jgi:hypothetical protein
MGKYRADDLLRPQKRKIAQDQWLHRRLAGNSGAEKVRLSSESSAQSKCETALEEALRKAAASAKKCN